MDERVYDELRAAIMGCRNEQAIEKAREIIDRKLDLERALEVMTAAIREIGEGFGKGELFLPDLVGASQALLAAQPLIEEELKRTGAARRGLGTVVAGTVYGDIHTIGKTMVATLLMAAGFNVHDAGINVRPEEFVRAVQEHRADILCMSALMTMTAPEQKKTIEALEETGERERVRVMVGGSAITQEFADSIGADGYDPIAPGAVELAKKLMGN
jgi:methylmalonyl-CoA mutase cobalamin-binding domain/chain